MTPFWIPRQGASLNYRRHTVLRRRLARSSPWAVAIITILGVLLWLISIFH